MRGVVSAGMVSGLEELGLTDAFDAVYGSSAGAINAAYFLAGQARLGTRIYHEDINNARFISLGRPLRGRPIVDLDYLISDVIPMRKPLDISRVLSAPSPLTVLATDAASGAGVAFRSLPSGTDLLGALRAGATMPVIAGTAFAYHERRFFDASLSEPIPVPTAEADGHTHLLVLLTRTGAMRPQPSAFDRYFVGPRLKRWSPELAARYLARAAPYSTLMAALETGWGPARRAQVATVRAGMSISKLERSANVLRDGAGRGRAAVLALFG